MKKSLGCISKPWRKGQWETGDPLEVPVCQSIIVPVVKGLGINTKTAKAVAPAKEMSCPSVNNEGAKGVIPN